MFADHVHGTQAVGCYYSLGVRMGNRKGMFHADHFSPLDGISLSIPVTNWVDAELSAWASIRGRSIDTSPTPVKLRFSCVPYTTISVDDLLCPPFEGYQSRIFLGQDYYLTCSCHIIRVREFIRAAWGGIEVDHGARSAAISVRQVLCKCLPALTHESLQTLL